ncbi:MAG TPA: amidohydrolase family protein [Thermoplasmata archaeon]|nr:amidohydrolase family protein [Thermoplasmata archaeon]
MVRVDTHLHLSPWWPDLAHTAYRADLDYTVGGLLAEMDQSAIDYGLVIEARESPSPAESLAESRTILAASQGRLRPVVTVDPTRGRDAIGEAIALWESEPNLAGVKLYPGYQPFYPHDPLVEPIYEFAHARRLPVLIHQGDTLARDGRIKFARPIEVDEVAVRFRDVEFVLCHLGNPWIEEAAELVYKNENVYADTSGLLAHPSAPLFDRMREQCRERIAGALVQIGSADRLLYGSDWPLEELSLAIDLVARLDAPAVDRARILGENARRLFQLPEAPAHRPHSR